MSLELTPALEGFALGGGLIITIGAQNAYLIRQGIREERVFFIATICFLSDALLIVIGAAGIGSVIASDQLLRNYAAWGGSFFLIVYGAKSALATFNPKPLIHRASIPANPRGFWKVALTTLALTFLNPHVYLDTVVLVGGVAAQYDEIPRTYFTLGAILASCTWFYGLAVLSAKAAPLFETKSGTRLLDGMVCITMWMVALSLIQNVVA